MDDLENVEICKKCGGRCCQSCGCIFSPFQFKELTKESLLEILKTGIVSIDTSSNDIYYLRIRNEGDPIVDMFGGHRRCILWNSKHGCPLSFRYRPAEAVHFIPSEKGWNYCHLDDESKYGLTGLSGMWSKFQYLFDDNLFDYASTCIPESKHIMCSIQRLKSLIKENSAFL